jgi:hypothetical protein
MEIPTKDLWAAPAQRIVEALFYPAPKPSNETLNPATRTFDMYVLAFEMHFACPEALGSFGSLFVCGFVADILEGKRQSVADISFTVLSNEGQPSLIS